MFLHGYIHESPKVNGLWYNKLNNAIIFQKHFKIISFLKKIIYTIKYIKQTESHI